MFKKIYTSRLLQAGLAIVLVLVVVLSVPSTRALAEKFLNLFRSNRLWWCRSISPVCNS